MDIHEADRQIDEMRAANQRGEIGLAIGYARQIIEHYPKSSAADEARTYLATNVPGTAIAFAAGGNDAPIQRVTVVDVDISFGQLVSLFVKGSIALIPAAIILGAIGFVAFFVLGAIFGRSL